MTETIIVGVAVGVVAPTVLSLAHSAIRLVRSTRGLADVVVTLQRSVTKLDRRVETLEHLERRRSA